MKDNLVKINLSEIDSFKEHPFSVNKDDSLMELVHSIKENGLLNPMIVRKKDNGRYEMISGHRRKAALEILGIDESEVVLKELNDEMKNFGSVATHQLKEVGNELKDTGSKIEETWKALSGVSATATAGLIASGKAAMDNETAINRYMTATGEAVEETEKYKSIMQEIYSSNYGDSIEDVANKMSLVKQNLGDISDEQLKSLPQIPGITNGLYASLDFEKLAKE